MNRPKVRQPQDPPAARPGAGFKVVPQGDGARITVTGVTPAGVSVAAAGDERVLVVGEVSPALRFLPGDFVMAEAGD